MVDVHCALPTQLHDQQTSLQIKGGQTMIFFSKPQTKLQTGDSKLTLEIEHRQTFQLPYCILSKSYWILHVSKFQWLIRKALFDNITSYGPTLYWQNSMHFNYTLIPRPLKSWSLLATQTRYTSYAFQIPWMCCAHIPFSFQQHYNVSEHIAILSYHPYICSLVPRPLPSFL